MNNDNLIKMANDIGNFFQAESDRELAVNGIAEHLRKFWDPRMRRQIVAYCQTDGEQLSDLVRDAVKRLAAS